MPSKIQILPILLLALCGRQDFFKGSPKLVWVTSPRVGHGQMCLLPTTGRVAAVRKRGGIQVLLTSFLRRGGPGWRGCPHLRQVQWRHPNTAPYRIRLPEGTHLTMLQRKPQKPGQPASKVLSFPKNSLFSGKWAHRV